MNRAAVRELGILLAITLILFYPLFCTHYFYTDEISQLTHYRPGADFHMFTGQGRILTDMLFQSLFNRITTIRQITFLRLFSLLGWMACIPIWYWILSKVSRQENLPRLLPFFTVLYLICCPPFCVYVSWASCMELFIANTSGLLAGYILYSNIKVQPVSGNSTIQPFPGSITVYPVSGNITVPPAPQIIRAITALPARAIAASLIFGLISLFTYQNGFGCFLLPFILHLLSQKQRSGTIFFRTIGIGIGLYLATYLLYYLLFSLQMNLSHIHPVDRTGFSMDPLYKIEFFFARPLPAAFHFTWIANEQSRLGLLVYLIIAVTGIGLNFFLLRSRSVSSGLRYGIVVLSFLGLIYLPSLIVKENYASNRTLLGLDMAVFLLVFVALLQILQRPKQRLQVVGLLGVFFVANAWYNFHYLFLQPVKKEYELVRNYIEAAYQPGITSIAFIRPSPQLFQHLYGINSSWDEFGAPSTYREWVPVDFVRQVVWEKTGNRAAADSLVIVNWTDKQHYLASNSTPDAHTLTIDVEQIMQ